MKTCTTYEWTRVGALFPLSDTTTTPTQHFADSARLVRHSVASITALRRTGAVTTTVGATRQAGSARRPGKERRIAAVVIGARLLGECVAAPSVGTAHTQRTAGGHRCARMSAVRRGSVAQCAVPAAAVLAALLVRFGATQTRERRRGALWRALFARHTHERFALRCRTQRRRTTCVLRIAMSIGTPEPQTKKKKNNNNTV